MATKVRPTDKILERIATRLAGTESTQNVVEIQMVDGFQDIVQRALAIATKRQPRKW